MSLIALSPASAIPDTTATTFGAQQSTITLANTEQTTTIAAGTTAFIIINRGITYLRVGFSSGSTNGAAHVTIAPNASLTFTDVVSPANRTIYLQSGNAGDLVQILTVS